MTFKRAAQDFPARGVNRNVVVSSHVATSPRSLSGFMCTMLLTSRASDGDAGCGKLEGATITPKWA